MATKASKVEAATEEVADSGRTIHERMAAVFADLRNLPKSGYNKFFAYAYVTESDMSAAIRPLFAREGLYLLATDEDVTLVEPGHVLLKTRYVVRSVTGEQVEFVGYGEGRDVSSKGVVGDKALYKAKTGALKYALMKSFMVDTGDDPERFTDAAVEPRNGGQSQSAPRAASARSTATKASAPARSAEAEFPPEADDSAVLDALSTKVVQRIAIQAKRVASVLEFEGWDKASAWTGAHEFFARLLGIARLDSIKDLTPRQADRIGELMMSRTDDQVASGVRTWLEQVGYRPPAPAE